MADQPAVARPHPSRWPGVTYSYDSLYVFDLFAGFVVRVEILRHRLQRGIELNERVFNRGVSVVAGPALVALRHGLGCLGIRFKAVVGPFVGISGGVFDFDRQAHQIGLKVPLLVDRAFAFGVALVDYKHRILWPLAALEKFLIGPALYEYVRELLVASGRGTVVHAITRGEKLPIAVVRRTYQIALRVVLWLGPFFLRRCSQQYQAESEDHGKAKNRFHLPVCAFHLYVPLICFSVRLNGRVL